MVYKLTHETMRKLFTGSATEPKAANKAALYSEDEFKHFAVRFVKITDRGFIERRKDARQKP